MSGSESGISETRVIAELVSLVRSYGSLPRAIFALISLYLLDGIFSIFGVIVGSILFVFDTLVGSLETALSLLLGAFSAVGVDILGVFLALERTVAGVVASAGPLAPVIAVGGTALILWIVWEFGSRLAIGILGELPGGSTLLSLVGWD